MESGNDHCYRLNHVGETWDGAFDTCNGSLLYIDNDEEFEFVRNSILEPQAERSVLWLSGRKNKQGEYWDSRRLV